MKIPKRLKIGAHNVEVKELEKLDGDGEFDQCKDIIYLNRNLSQKQKEETLIHEILGYQNPSFHGDNHGLLQAIANGIYQVLEDNNLFK